jgi:hypothetical protein
VPVAIDDGIDLDLELSSGSHRFNGRHGRPVHRRFRRCLSSGNARQNKNTKGSSDPNASHSRKVYHRLTPCRSLDERKGHDEANQIYNAGMTGIRPTKPVEEAAQSAGLPPRVVVVLAHLDPWALGVAGGTVCGFWLWLATVILLVRGGSTVGTNLSLLSQYFIGFRVTPLGSLAAFVYGFVTAFLIGYLFARLRNFMVHSYLLYLRRRAERAALSDMLDRLM